MTNGKDDKIRNEKGERGKDKDDKRRNEKGERTKEKWLTR